MATSIKLVPRSESQRRDALEKCHREILQSESKSTTFVTSLLSATGVSAAATSFASVSSYLHGPQSSSYEAVEYQTSIGENKVTAKNLYAQLPDTIASDPNDINRINRAGELFIQQNKCPPLNRSIRKFKQTIKTVEDVEKLVTCVMATLKVITVATVAGPDKVLCTNPNDLKEVFLGCLSGLINSTSINDKIDQEWHSPLVTPENSVSWLKCKLSSELTISQYCFYQTKDVELTVEYYAFFFPTVNDFNHALNYAENQSKK
uniref:Uncharacterized protein n=1 Tax=Panagrolaimus sp. ES5 TaxID=591445 RepID=A0AC34G1L1_9BILA